MENYSVLMSVYYKEQPDWLNEAIKTMLEQTLPPNEFVIVKDGKLTKELDEIIDGYVEKYPDLFNIVALENNSGLGIALCEGIKRCKNEIVARMDSDDIALPERCEREMHCLTDDPELQLVGSSVMEFCGSIDNVLSYRKLPETNEEINKFARKRCPFAHPSVMYRKQVVLNAGNYRHYPYFEDYDLWVRMLTNGCKCKNIGDCLVYMRVNEDFYKRRGGVKYLKNVLKFKKEQYKNGFYSFKDYIISAGSHTVVCLMPNFLRDFVYKKMLRKKAKQG